MNVNVKVYGILYLNVVQSSHEQRVRTRSQMRAELASGCIVHISRHPDAPTQVQQGVTERRGCVGVERAQLPLRHRQTLATATAAAAAAAAAIVVEQCGGSEA